MVDFYCLLAESLDAEELEDYNYAVLTAIAFNSPKQIKNWKWQSIDKAGTVSYDYSPKAKVDVIADKLKEFGKQVFKFNVDSAKSNPTRAMEFAKITGRDIIFMNPDGILFNENAEPLKEYKGNGIIIRLDYDGNYA